MSPAAAPSRRRPATAARPVSSLGAAAALFFRFWSPRLLGLQFGLALLLRPFAGGWGPGDLAIVAGVAIYWPLQEWFLHIFLLHWRPRRIFGRLVDPRIAQIHRAHHRDPWNLGGALLPGRLIAAMIPAHLALWLLATPTRALALTGILAFGGAALLYEWIHYLTHTAYRPRSRLYRAIWRGHRLHHFKNERYWHGFTFPWVDTLLGTAPDPRTIPTSATCMTLGIEDNEG